MGLRFLAMSRAEASAYTNAQSHIFIQIGNPPIPIKQPPRFPKLRREGLVASCRLSFRDFLEPSLDRSWFGKGHARKILAFVAAYTDDVALVCVHCLHGQNRSTGVAAALDYLYNGEGSQRKWIRRGFNPWVYALMVREGLALRIEQL